jgi:hypothetical protein
MGREDENGSEILMNPHCLGSWLTDGGEVVNFTNLPFFAPRNMFYFCLWYSFLLEAE